LHLVCVVNVVFVADIFVAQSFEKVCVAIWRLLLLLLLLQ